MPETNSPDSVVAFGLTGGIASGKSTVARFFERFGAQIIDADRIGHEEIEPGRPAFDEVVEHFGKKILAPDGSIDRKKLGPIVFANPGELAALNAIVHPRIIAREDQLARELYEAHPGGVIVVDAALIFESGIGRNLRKIVVAWCRPEQQVDRLMAKTGIDREEAERRIRAQMPAEEKRRRADYVIDCSGTLGETLQNAEVVYQELRKIAQTA